MTVFIIAGLVDTDRIDPKNAILGVPDLSERSLAIACDGNQCAVATESTVPRVVSVFCSPTLGQCLVNGRCGHPNFVNRDRDLVRR
jgi:hypothetical protein